MRDEGGNDSLWAFGVLENDFYVVWCNSQADHLVLLLEKLLPVGNFVHTPSSRGKGIPVSPSRTELFPAE
jgi:hypothetical protein